MDDIIGLKLENQLCFPLYAASKEVVRKYKPFLDALDLTYTQYIVMMVVWQRDKTSVGEIGEQLFLDSGTLTPLLKSLEKKGLIKRERDKDDERILNVTYTEKGKALYYKAADVPPRVCKLISLTEEETAFLYKVLYKLLGKTN